MTARRKPRDATKTQGKSGKRLSYEQRIQIFTLRTNAELSYTQISEALKINRSTVRAVLKSGLITPKKPEQRIPKLNLPPSANTYLNEQLLNTTIEISAADKAESSKESKFTECKSVTDDQILGLKMGFTNAM